MTINKMNMKPAEAVKELSKLLEHYSEQANYLRAEIDAGSKGNSWEHEWARYEREAQCLRMAIVALESPVEPTPDPHGMSTPWPLPDVLAKLIAATEHLLRDHDCDAHGHEEYKAAVDSGKTLLAGLRSSSETDSRYEWLRQHPDEFASAVADAYGDWDGQNADDFGGILDEEIEFQKRKQSPQTTSGGT